MGRFQMVTDLPPRGDQPKAIEQLVESIQAGNKYTTLLGVTGSGKSVAPETPVLLRVDGRVRVEPIGPFVDALMERGAGHVRREGDTEVLPASCVGTRVEAFSFDPATGRTGWKPVRAFLRHRSPSLLWRVTTACGREVTVTGDHNFFVARNGRLVLVSTAEVREGDFLPVPRALPEPEQPLGSVHPEVAGGDGRDVPVPWRHRAEPAKLPLARSAGPAAGVKERARTVRGGAQAAYPFALSEPFLRLLGYFVGGGHGEEGCFVLSCKEPEGGSDFLRAVETLGLPWSHTPGDSEYRVWSGLWSRLLTAWCGREARSKRLPPFWPELSNAQLAQVLRAYFTVRGKVERDAVVTATASPQLACDLAYALLRFGIVARMRRRPSARPGRASWTVRVSGPEAVRRFREAIGFASSRKEARLDTRQPRTAGSRVDGVPWDGKALRQLRRRLGVSQQVLSHRVGCTPSRVRGWEAGRRLPSPREAEAVVRALREEAHFREDWAGLRQLQEVEGLLRVFWTPVGRVERLPGEGFVYDLSVEEDETFLAGFGGLFVHNTYTMARVIERIQKPTLVIAHNKTLAAQLYSEFRQFFPHNAVRYFVSYYDYYQPEAYVPQTDLYIAKDASINDEIDRLRHATTKALMERRDVIVVASVSCIYGLGRPEDYREVVLVLRRGERRTREEILRRLVDVQYERNDVDFARGRFRVRGDVIEVFPSYEERAVRVELFGDEVDRILELDPLTGEVLEEKDVVAIWPAKHWVTTEDRLERALRSIEEELQERVAWFRSQGKLLEAQRLEFRTRYDLELLRETGYCPGIENYSRHLDGRAPGERPGCLLDYFPRDYLMFIDESHVTVPQIKGMHEGDRARKKNLVDYGWRLPSAYDNRPLRWDEFEQLIHQCVFVSATPGPFELEVSSRVVEQIVRPTGLVDPQVEVRPARGQVDDLLAEIRSQVERGERTLVTTLTKRMAEDLTAYLQEMGLKVHYLHSEIDTLERVQILKDLRLGTYDVLVGINLLREGLDLPEVSLVAVLDADREGYLRSETALIQTMGRAARNVSGRVILYADEVTESMRRAIEETNRRRQIQLRYNEEHGITPQTVQKPIRDLIDLEQVAEPTPEYRPRSGEVLTAEELVRLVEEQGATVPWEVARLLLLSPEELEATVDRLEREMRRAAANLEFEKAAKLRDQIAELRKGLGEPYFAPVGRRPGRGGRPGRGRPRR